MVKYYVTIPLGVDTDLPSSCPFTGHPKPKRTVAVWHPPFRIGPLAALFKPMWGMPKIEVRFPCVTSRWSLDRLLKMVTMLVWLVAIYFILFGGPNAEQKRAMRQAHISYHWQFRILFVVLRASALYWIIQGLRILNLREVRIHSRGVNWLDVQFKREDYARELCRLNNLLCHQNSFEERRTKYREEPPTPS